MEKIKKYFIITFGCQQNEADSERIASMLKNRGMEEAGEINEADHVIINTCMIRESAENRVYGAVNNLGKKRTATGKPEKIVVTGCMVGMSVRDKTGKLLKLLRRRMPHANEFLPIEEVGFDHAPLRTDQTHAWVPISNGCNNFCTFCVVPFTRGREISRPFAEVIAECRKLAGNGFKQITLLGMNVNSYGADLIVGENNIQVMRDTGKKYFLPEEKKLTEKITKGFQLPDGRIIKPVMVTHLSRLRIPTLFPYLLSEIAEIPGLTEINFMSSNPWDFSDELISVIAGNPKISRTLHIAVQSGSDAVLKRMNRWYTAKQYIALISKLKAKISKLKISTDIIVGFCGETEDDFKDTVAMVKKADFYKAYISIYSDRPMTAAHKSFQDDVPFTVKKKRWQILEDLINKYQ